MSRLTQVDEPKAALTDDFPQPPSCLVAGIQDEAFWERFGKGLLLGWSHGD